MPHDAVDEQKNAARRRTWDLLDQADAAHGGSTHGRIPNFRGADQAAALLATLPLWQQAQAIKAVPDRAQHPVRALALEHGKTLYMAVPKIADLKPFRRLNLARLDVTTQQAASSSVAVSVGDAVGVDEVQPIDLIVCGSVAVNRDGVRLGKGAGYSDIEVALLTEAGHITHDTTIVTTVHPLQVVDDDLPETRHDFRVDLIVTTEQVITCNQPSRPTGLYWDDLTAEKIAAIPALAERKRAHEL
ncbi:5-formyltetrahydrofolate cyclo-ligase [Haloechinothrix salitolerans]|uniref:5-formyltetrahydrofolate cyclo-ligase n=1 Tax=Haloechinothrix salitolerans TaxID=926830 RepID=A0ABW2BVZ1_9PSEU